MLGPTRSRKNPSRSFGPGRRATRFPSDERREVLLELIGLATQRLTVVSFAAYKVPEVLTELTTAATRGVDIRLILETAEDSGGRLSHDAAEAFGSLRDVAGFFVWPLARRPKATAGVGTLHAKAVLADSAAVFITSANMTGAAFSNNMELGLVVKGGSLPGRLHRHFDGLVASGVLERVT